MGLAVSVATAVPGAPMPPRMPRLAAELLKDAAWIGTRLQICLKGRNIQDLLKLADDLPDFSDSPLVHDRWWMWESEVEGEAPTWWYSPTLFVEIGRAHV